MKTHQCGCLEPPLSSLTPHSSQPGFVVKAKDVNTGKKLFLNLCQNELVGMATAVPSASAGKGCQKWSIPYSLTPPKEDIDSGG